MGVGGWNGVAATTYHHIVDESVDVICLYFGLGEENLGVHFNILLGSNISRYVLADGWMVYLKLRWNREPLSIGTSKRTHS